MLSIYGISSLLKRKVIHLVCSLIKLVDLCPHQRCARTSTLLDNYARRVNTHIYIPHHFLTAPSLLVVHHFWWRQQSCTSHLLSVLKFGIWIGGGCFSACEDYRGRCTKHSIPVPFFQWSLHISSPLFLGQRSVHSGSACRDTCGRAFPNQCELTSQIGSHTMPRAAKSALSYFVTFALCLQRPSEGRDTLLMVQLP